MSAQFLLPDILLVVLALGIFILDLFRVPAKVLWHLSWLGLAGILVGLNLLPAGSSSREFIGSWHVSNFGLLMREFFVLSALLATLLSHGHFLKPYPNSLKRLPEFLFTLIVVTLGSITIVSGKDLLTLFVGLELATIPLYFLVAWNKKSTQSAEASTKYILMGSASTAFMLFGLSYFYGLAGSLRLDVLAQAVHAHPHSALLWIGVIFFVSGIGFKLTLFPFHTWAPDVYEGAPTPVTAFLSVSSKATAIVFLITLLYGPLASIHQTLEPLLLLLAIATMTAGNLGAMRQSRLKRFMAWSSIAQAGYILTALLGAPEVGTPAIVFYLFVYAFANYLMFFIITLVGQAGKEDFTQLQGLAKSSPALGGILCLTMFSLAGIPPVAGFLGKFFLFGSAASAGHYVLLVIAGANSTVSLYYYLQILRAAYVKPATTLPVYELSLSQKISMGLLSALVLGAGFAPWMSNNIQTILSVGP